MAKGKDWKQIFKKEIMTLLRLLRKKGDMTEQEFDRIFREEYSWTDPGTGETVHCKNKVRFRYFLNTNGLFMGDIFELGNWSKWVNLIQVMSLLDLVDMKRVGGSVVYSLTIAGHKAAKVQKKLDNSKRA